MPEGIISSWTKRAKHGRIHANDDGRELHFQFRHLVNTSIDPQEIRVGMKVSFEVDENNKVTTVTLGEGAFRSQKTIGPEVTPGELSPIPDPSDQEHPGRFHNPYNFVRNLKEARSSGSLLGNCPPPPHDRYIGLTGRITCTVKTVTPLFISDSHDVGVGKGNAGEGEPEKKAHPSYRFFTVPGKNGRSEPALPASSLRGMIRSVFESITNSCYSIFDGDRTLEFREGTRYGNDVKENPGIVRKLATELEPGEIESCLQAAIGCYYGEGKRRQNASHSRDSIASWKPGERVVARAHQTKRCRFVREFAESEDKLQSLENGQVLLEGWLKITGRGEETMKRSEVLFLDPECPLSPDPRRYLFFDYEQQMEYNKILTSQIEQGQLPVEPQSKQLEVGDLVWLKIVGSGRKGKIERLVRVQIPRTSYRYRLKDFIWDHLCTCNDYDTLCPACRVFGWVAKETERNKEKENSEAEGEKQVAYAGRVRFSHALSTAPDGLQRFQDIPLAILSSPKPTKKAFYLLDSEGRPSASVDYSTSGARLRGRKFYLHHTSPNSREYVRAPLSNPTRHSNDQNRTVRQALASGAEFSFTLDFENMSELELGALLWSLEMEEGMHHRLGYAKPLGFGSVQIIVTELGVIDWSVRLASMDEEAGWRKIDKECCTERVKSLKDKFLKAMEAHYGESFRLLIAELKGILGVQSSPLPIHYPRLEAEPTEKGENFKWFGKREKEALPLATQNNGLPL